MSASDNTAGQALRPLPWAPFVLGVSGKMDFPGYVPGPEGNGERDDAVRALRERVYALLDWIRSPKGLFDPKTGAFDKEGVAEEPEQKPWRALGLKNTPIVVLSSLAPGADTIVAEAALDYAADQSKNDPLVSVRAPLPFPLEQYKRATTFVHHKAPEKENEARVKRFELVMERIIKQKKPAFVAERDLFEVRLDKHLDPDSPESDLSGVDANGPRRYIRYRAAGEFIATHSHLLLAVYDDEKEKPDPPSNRYACNTVNIVEAKRRGLSFELLALSNSFSWADNGPVLRIPIDNDTDGQEPCKRPLALLHPYDTKPVLPAKPVHCGRQLAEALSLRCPDEKRTFAEPGDLCDKNLQWQQDGDSLFRSILVHQEAFNGLEEHPKSASEWSNLLGKPRDPQKPLPPQAIQFAKEMSDFCWVRRQAAADSGKKEEKREQLMVRLARLIFAGAFFLSAFAHDAFTAGSSKLDPPLFSDLGGWVEGALLLLALGSFTGAAWVYMRYRCTGAESQRFDHRAIGEALRVQFYWALAGVHASAAAEYMQRQRGELSWIRYVVDGVTMPLERWRGCYGKLGHSARLSLLEQIRVQWVEGQRDYARKTARKNGGRLHVWGHWGWTLATAGFLSVILLMACEVSPRLHDWILLRAGSLSASAFVLGVFLLGLHVRRTWANDGDPHGELYDPPPCPPGAKFRERLSGFLGWLLLRPAALGGGLVLAAAALWIAGQFVPGSKASLPPTFLAGFVLAMLLSLPSYVWAQGRYRRLAEAHRKKSEQDHLEGKQPSAPTFGHRLFASWPYLIPMGVFATAFLLLRPMADDLPSASVVWGILTGLFFLSGATCLAWSERSFHAEHARHNLALLELYSCANRRLKELLDRYATEGSRDSATLIEIQSLLASLGREALEENAEWLILHRTRPLEPFLA